MASKVAASWRYRRLRQRQFLLFRITWMSLAFVLVFYLLFRSPLFELVLVNVQGINRLEGAEVIQLVGVQPGINIWQVDVDLVEQRVAAHPLVENVLVRRRLAGVLDIVIKERVPVAVVTAEQQNLVIDGKGMILWPEAGEPVSILPAITGVNTPDKLEPGNLLASPELMVALAVLNTMPSKQWLRVQRLDVRDPLALKLYTLEGIEVRLGSGEQLAAKIDRLQSVYPLALAPAHPSYIDVSFKGAPVVMGAGRLER